MSAFYEWQRAGGRSIPHAIRRKDGRSLALAGFWQPRRDTRRLLTCAILTCPPNSTVRPLHDRVPVVLPRTAWDAWLDPTNRDIDGLLSLLLTAPDGLLTAYRVGLLVGEVRNDGTWLLRPCPSDKADGALSSARELTSGTASRDWVCSECGDTVPSGHHVAFDCETLAARCPWCAIKAATASWPAGYHPRVERPVM